MISGLSQTQRCNFDLNSGVPIQKENEASLGPDARGEENREEASASPPHLTHWSGSAS